MLAIWLVMAIGGTLTGLLTAHAPRVLRAASARAASGRGRPRREQGPAVGIGADTPYDRVLSDGPLDGDGRLDPYRPGHGGLRPRPPGRLEGRRLAEQQGAAHHTAADTASAAAAEAACLGVAAAVAFGGLAFAAGARRAVAALTSGATTSGGGVGPGRTAVAAQDHVKREKRPRPDAHRAVTMAFTYTYPKDLYDLVLSLSRWVLRVTCSVRLHVGAPEDRGLAGGVRAYGRQRPDYRGLQGASASMTTASGQGGSVVAIVALATSRSASDAPRARLVRRAAATSSGTWQCRATRSAPACSAMRRAASRCLAPVQAASRTTDSPSASRADARSSRAA